MLMCLRSLTERKIALSQVLGRKIFVGALETLWYLHFPSVSRATTAKNSFKDSLLHQIYVSCKINLCYLRQSTIATLAIKYFTWIPLQHLGMTESGWWWRWNLFRYRSLWLSLSFLIAFWPFANVPLSPIDAIWHSIGFQRNEITEWWTKERWSPATKSWMSLAFHSCSGAFWESFCWALNSFRWAARLKLVTTEPQQYFSTTHAGYKIYLSIRSLCCHE